MNLLETTKLVKSFTGRTVVDEVSFVLSQEEIVGLLGRNGAGKTTTFRMILGMVTPESGAVALMSASFRMSLALAIWAKGRVSSPTRSA